MNKWQIFKYEAGRRYQLYSWLFKRKFSRKFKTQLTILQNTLIISKKLAKYLGEESERNPNHFECEIKDPTGITLNVRYSEEYYQRKIIKSVIELFKEVDGQQVLISRHSSSLDDLLPFQINPGKGLPAYLGGDLEGNQALCTMASYYSDNKDRIEEYIKNHPGLRLERLAKDFPELTNLNSLNRFIKSSLNSEDLNSLEEKLKEIYSSEKFLGIKIHKGNNLINDLIKQYSAAEKEKEEMKEKEKREEQNEMKKRIPEYMSEKDQKLEQIVQITKVPPIKMLPSPSLGAGLAGYRRDININVRSSWEANYARILMLQQMPFLYEPKTFELDAPEDMKSIFGGKEKVSYTPDFQIKDSNKFIDIKGDWFNYNGEESMAKIILFKRLNPNLQLDTIGIREYGSLENQFKEKINNNPMFCGWEYGGRNQGHNLATSPQDFI
jgi:hypothetical protein